MNVIPGEPSAQCPQEQPLAICTNIRPLNLVLIKKNQQLHSRSQYWNDNEAAPANGGFVNKANASCFQVMIFRDCCAEGTRSGLSILQMFDGIAL